MSTGPITALIEQARTLGGQKAGMPSVPASQPSGVLASRRPSQDSHTHDVYRGDRLKSDILMACDRIFQRDRVRFAKLIVWVHAARKRKYADTYILRTLTILDTREAEGKPITEWWPWCDRAIQYIRTRDKQGESQQYKKADFSSARAIMKELFKNL